MSKKEKNKPSKKWKLAKKQIYDSLFIVIIKYFLKNEEEWYKSEEYIEKCRRMI